MENSPKNHYFTSSKSEVSYSPDGNWFELGNLPMDTDVESFRPLNDFLGKGRNHIDFEANRIGHPRIDVESFYVKPIAYMLNMGFDKSGGTFLKQKKR